MNIQVQIKESKGSFFYEKGGERLAELTFSKAGENLLILDHTMVSEALRGQGAGNKLVMEAVNYARQQGHKIMPLCPFAKSVFEKNQDIKDVLH